VINSERALRARCSRRLRELNLDGAIRIETLCERLAMTRGRPINLEAVAFSKPGPCGVWIALDRADYILYEVNTSRPHQEHIIAHEMAHMICGHKDAEPLDETVIRSLFPDIDPAVIRSMLLRVGYSDRHEREAEIMASILLSNAGRRPAEPAGEIAPLERILRRPDLDD
jgi:hypothetical protein